MKNPTHTTFALAMLAAALPAQATARAQDATAALQRARLIERQEGDLEQAIAAYRELLQDDGAMAVHDRASLRLGALLWRLGQRDEATPLLQAAVQAGGDVAVEANAVLQSDERAQQDSKEREQKAEALLDRIEELLTPLMPGGAINPVFDELMTLEQELRWLGDDGARVLTRRIRAIASLDVQRSDSRQQSLTPLLDELCAMAWRSGTAPTADFLLEVAKDAPLPFQRFVSKRANHTARNVLPVLRVFLRTDDPTGEVWRNLLGVVRSLEYDDLLALAGDEHDATRSAALSAATNNWTNWTLPQREQFVARNAASITAVLHAPNRRLRTPAWELLAKFSYGGPTNGTRLLLAHAHEAPDTVPFPSTASATVGWRHVAADDAWIAAAAAASERLPRPLRPLDVSYNRVQYGVDSLVAHQQVLWTEAATSDVLTLVSRGFGIVSETDWYYPALASANGAQIAALIRSLPEHAQEDNVTRGLLDVPPTPEWFPAIRDVIDQCVAGDAVAWRGRANGSRMMWSASVDRLIGMAGRTKHPDAAAWLMGLAKRQTGLTSSCIDGLIEGSRGGDLSMRRSLREVLATDNEAMEVADYQRAHVFHELTRAGDVEAIPIMAASYGFASPNSMSTPRQLDALFDRSSGAVHGYTDEQLARLWSALLTGPASDAVWSDLETVRHRAEARRDNARYSLPEAAIPAFVTALRARGGDQIDDESELFELLAALGSVERADLDADPALRDAVQRAVTHPDARVATESFLWLREDLRPRYVDDAKKAFVKLPASQRRSMAADALPLTADDWRPLLAGEGATFAIARIDDDMVRNLLPELEACLRSDTIMVRREAAQKLAQVLGEDSVPLLLPLLRDSAPYVREMAAKLLDVLRDARMQADYWSRAGDGIDTSKAGAARKLLAQAKPDQDQAQRLLAIRSLALLDAPEALPYLIDWTKDADERIQKAALDAIQQMHRRGAAK